MSLIKPYRNGFQKGFNSYPGTNEKTGIEFDILITDKDEEHEFGEKENEIYEFLKNKYGNWIVYDPEFSIKTFLLWALPLILFVFGGLLIIRKVSIK